MWLSIDKTKNCKLWLINCRSYNNQNPNQISFIKYDTWTHFPFWSNTNLDEIRFSSLRYISNLIDVLLKSDNAIFYYYYCPTAQLKKKQIWSIYKNGNDTSMIVAGGNFDKWYIYIHIHIYNESVISNSLHSLISIKWRLFTNEYQFQDINAFHIDTNMMMIIKVM